MRNDLHLDPSDRISPAEWERTTSPSCNGDDGRSSITYSNIGSCHVSECGDVNFITGWSELDELQKQISDSFDSGAGESVTIRLRVKEDGPADSFAGADDSIQLDPRRFANLLDLLKRAEKSHKLSTTIPTHSPNSNDIHSSSPNASPTPTSECSGDTARSSSTAVKSPRHKPTHHAPTSATIHAQELLRFLMKGEDSKGLHISVDTADASFVPPAAARAKSSPSGSAASTVVDDRYEELPPPEPVLVVVESKKAKKLRKKGGANHPKGAANADPATPPTSSDPKKTPVTQTSPANFSLNPYVSLQTSKNSALPAPLPSSLPASSTTAFVSPIPKKAPHHNPTSSKKKSKKNAPTRRQENDDELLLCMAAQSPLQRLKLAASQYLSAVPMTHLYIVLALFALISSLYLGDFHNADSSVPRIPPKHGAKQSAAPVQPVVQGVGIVMIYPLQGGVIDDTSEKLKWRMFGSGVTPREEFEINVLVDGIVVINNDFLLPESETEYVDGTMDIDFSAIKFDTGNKRGGMSRGTHNVTLSVVAKRTGETGVGTSVFLYMPKAAPPAPVPAAEASTVRAAVVDRESALLSIEKPLTGSRTVDNSVVLKFASQGFHVGNNKEEIQVLLEIDGNKDVRYELTEEANTLSGLSVGEHVMKVYLIDREDGSTLSSDETIFAVAAPGEEIFSEDVVLMKNAQGEEVWESMSSVDNANLIRLANDDTLWSSSRKYILSELESRFEAEKSRRDGW